jgi:sialic acid synthase SpsE
MKNQPTLALKKKTLGGNNPPFIIAELGANHNGDMALARKLIDQAKAAGADCAKFQSWSKDSVFSKIVYQQNYFLNDDYRNRTDYTLEQIVDKYSIKPNELREMKKYCDDKGIVFASSPFSKPEVDLLVELDVDFIKIASMDCTNFPFLKYVAQTKKPIVLSTGFAKFSEIAAAVETIEAEGNTSLCILHCVSNYPPKDTNVNLNNMETLHEMFPQYPIGFSDHTLGTSIPLAAIAKGACLIEKHFTLDKEMPGWDHKISADQKELETICTEGRRINEALGSFRRKVTSDDLERMPAFRRSVVTAGPIKKGQVIRREDLDFKRPGSGIPPGQADWIVGSTAKHDLEADVLIKREDY